MRPDYCRAVEPDPCPDCGATVDGNDPVHGCCQARFNGPPPEPLVYLVLVDRDTGKEVARLH